MTRREWHHGYTGALVVGLACGVITWTMPTAWALFVAGSLLVLDDVLQHQTLFRYRSPVNRLWGWLLRRFE